MDKCIHGSTLPGCWPCAQAALVDDVTMFKAVTSNMSERAQARLNIDPVREVERFNKERAFPVHIPIHEVGKIDPLNPPPENSIGLTKEEFNMLTARDWEVSIPAASRAEAVDWAKKTPAEIEADIIAAQANEKRRAQAKELNAIIDPPPMPQIDDNRTGLIDGRVVTLDQLRFFTDPNTTMLVADGRRLRIMYDMKLWTMKRDPLAVAIWTEFEKCEAEIMPRGNLHESLDELRASLDRLQQLCDRHGWHEYKHTLHSG